ncbi:MAG: heme-copper oxidase subunit III [Chloroflexi bacterium]|nr:heme-copper oxidase subunit III [Chloroflexota bacterium]
MAQHVATAGEHAETTTGVDNRKLLMWLFLASECLFFGGLIGTYLLYRDATFAACETALSALAASAPAPAECVFPVDTVVAGREFEGLFDIPFTSVSAFVLLMSSVSMVLALAAIQRNDKRGLRIWLMCTALLGMTFLAGQAFEFTAFVHEGLSLDTNLFGTTFFVLTGFHGAHVSIGVLIILSLFVMAWRGRIDHTKSLNIELAGLYWHFVDIVWIVIFTLIYLVQT